MRKRLHTQEHEPLEINEIREEHSMQDEKSSAFPNGNSGAVAVQDNSRKKSKKIVPDSDEETSSDDEEEKENGVLVLQSDDVNDLTQSLVNLNHDPTKLYLTKDRLGKGASSTLLEGRLQGENVAVKFLSLNPLPTAQELQKFRNEIGMSVAVSKPHSRLVKIKAVSFGNPAAPLIQPFLVMELLSYNLNFLLHAKVTHLNDFQRIKLCLIIAHAILHLHSMNIVHGDLKPRDIMLDDHLNAKLIDFGLTNFVSAVENEDRSHFALAYTAPEILFNRSPKNALKSEIYALGVLFWEILQRKRPWQEYSRNHYALLKNLAQGTCLPLPESWPKDIKDLLSAMMGVSKNRPSIEEVIPVLRKNYIQALPPLLQKEPQKAFFEEVSTENVSSSTVIMSAKNLEEIEVFDPTTLYIGKDILAEGSYLKDKLLKGRLVGETVLVQFLALSPTIDYVWDIELLKRMLRMQSTVAKTSDHLVKIKGVSFGSEDAPLINPFIITEFLPYNLDKALANPKLIANKEQRLQLCLNIAKGVSYLHSMKILHRSLKPTNILVDDHLNAKLTDFGLANYLAEGGVGEGAIYHRTKISWRHILYTPPEVFENKTYDEKAEVYALGVILCHVLLNNKLQTLAISERHPNLQHPEFAKMLTRGMGLNLEIHLKFAENLDKNCKELLFSMIGPRESRPTAQQVVERLEIFLKKENSMVVESTPIEQNPHQQSTPSISLHLASSIGMFGGNNISSVKPPETATLEYTGP